MTDEWDPLMNDRTNIWICLGAAGLNICLAIWGSHAYWWNHVMSVLNVAAAATCIYAAWFTWKRSRQ